ncbi:MAG: UDP-N-acetylmuramoyl-tripeptide--D-alanyl-D-alanine ligase [Planctomycetota bacterium]|jgi:UDP-N-acetylmuramoyl-tripeptide--D-alanyl-D-alanine ligase
MQELYEKVIQAEGVCYDSRKALPGQVFFAFKDQRDGNNFAADALEKGCVYAVIDSKEMQVPGDDRYILVEDAYTALQGIAKLHRAKFDIPIIGITGSNGKTTTKELLSRVLAKKYQVLSTHASYNSGIGLPIMVLSLRPEHEIAVLEMGANHIGEIAEICEIAQPTHGIITNISAAHIGEFGSLQNIIDTKKALFAWLRDHGGHAFVHADDEVVMNLAHDIDQTTYSIAGDADCIVRPVGYTPFATIESGGREQSTHLFGAYNIINMAAAVTVGMSFGVSLTDALEATGSFVPDNNRSQVEQYDAGTLIIDCYNANPVSMGVALEAFVDWPTDAKDKVVIIGGMRELGHESRHAHAAVIDTVREYMFSAVYFVGPEFIEVREDDFGVYFNTVADMISWIDSGQFNVSGKTIFLKSSLGTNLLALLPLVRTMISR